MGEPRTAASDRGNTGALAGVRVVDLSRVLAKRHPRLVYCSITGFGADGPLGGLPGYDAVLRALCGVMSINGTTDSGPMRMGVPIVDYLTGYSALTGIDGLRVPAAA